MPLQRIDGDVVFSKRIAMVSAHIEQPVSTVHHTELARPAVRSRREIPERLGTRDVRVLRGIPVCSRNRRSPTRNPNAGAQATTSLSAFSIADSITSSSSYFVWLSPPAMSPPHTSDQEAQCVERLLKQAVKRDDPRTQCVRQEQSHGQQCGADSWNPSRI